MAEIVDNTKWEHLNTKNFKETIKICNRALAHSLLYGLTGDSGYGKSTAFEAFNKMNLNVFILQLDKTLTPKTFYLLLLKTLRVYDWDTSSSLSSMALHVATVLSKTGKKNLLIFDDAGRFSKSMLEFFQSIRDSTELNTGIILSGTSVFKSSFDSWVEKRARGIPELNTRIFDWVELPKPTYSDLFQIATANGVSDKKEADLLAKNSGDYRTLKNKVLKSRILKSEEAQNQVQSQSQETN